MLAKISPGPDRWDKNLHLVEFNINNKVNKSTRNTPSRLLFGTDQKGKVIDSLRGILENIEEDRRDVSRERGIVAEKIEKIQEYNTKYYNRNRSDSRKYNIGDYVAITNTISTPGVNKNLMPKFRGPYVISKCLGNDRYVVKDVDSFQLTNIPFDGIYDSSRIKPWTQDDPSTS
ncbi:hypothetical protein QE152_g38313 [Popillia japonica]|uniref:Uncharacterized protein n=1 Tax=Popillia japonica TaxID=7064 RepID=A0AAW1I784_POPJA